MTDLTDAMDWFGKGGWRPWMMYPPCRGDYQVVELLRSDGPNWMQREPDVARLDDLLRPENAAWNVANLYWRPVL